MSVTWRSWTLASLSVAAGLAVLVLLSTMQFEATLTRLVQGRLAILAQSTELSFRSAATLGLPLSSFRNASAILERARQTDPRIAAIHVYDQLGRVVHSTDPAPPEALDAPALQAYQAARDDSWEVETSSHLLSGAVVLNALRSQSLGGVVVVYPKTEIATATLAMSARLTLVAAAIAIGAAACSLPVLALSFSRLERPALAIAAALDGLERKGWRSGAGGPVSESRPGAADEGVILVRHALAAEDRYRNAGLELAEVEATGTHLAPDLRN